MKPKILDINADPFDWNRGNAIAERELLFRTLELGAEIPGDYWFVELGTFMGINARNFILALNQLNKNCRFASVDFNPWNYRVKFYPKEEWTKRCSNISGPCVQHFFEGKTIDHADSFNDESISWLFIDACHCYECVRDEIKLYSPKLVPGGYMLFHDTSVPQNQQWVTHTPPKPYGVLKAITNSSELKLGFTKIAEVKTNHGTQVWRKNEV